MSCALRQQPSAPAIDDGERAYVTGRCIDRFEQRSGAMALEGYPCGGRRTDDFS
jgi:hypothetical protein